MCGIVGYFSKTTDHKLLSNLNEAVVTLNHRGPDAQRVLELNPNVGFAHARLSIIDTSDVAHQPMHDVNEKFTIIFNGEIFNFKELRHNHLKDVKFHSASDTEVLLHLYMKYGKACLAHLNGFFAFAIHDREKDEVFLARDRYGIKPLHIYSDEHQILFSSEIKALLKFPIQKEINFDTLALYLQLNYIPDEHSMLRGVKRLKPGHFALINHKGDVTCEQYYSIPYQPGLVIPETYMDYSKAKTTLKQLVEDAVQRRLVSDVPLGTFLSGGIDSSIVTACAAKHVKHLNTFSIGYSDSPYFDETKYARLVAQKCKTNHEVFYISSNEIRDSIFSVLDYLDEPFADSSALAVYVLSKKTRKHVTVALSGDGGDEVFGGYNKHRAELRARANDVINLLIRTSLPILRQMPSSRNSKLGNLFRQLSRYGKGLQQNNAERYWDWCALNSEANALALLKHNGLTNKTNANQRAASVLNLITETGNLNDVLLADMQMVLSGDMLVKVDLMSMANSLEVRVPLLDYTIVNFAFSLPASFKTNKSSGKKILKDAFREELPSELFSRSKQGFEVPLLKWLRSELWHLIDTELLSEDFIEAQDIFNSVEIEKLKKRLFSNNPGDAHAQIWGLLVFQYWYKKYFSSNA